ncbi:hypothetical protein J3R30DRAFT_3702569 [Lentinula aciculospora]|uniref:Uncharacterized protein n=1 Tax=Lentinula aciculospora TaxID=153920 RepID=A0A9W9AC89_9AGAR|nr:hypothetical protein J3R30DRAFT_3702569 [Lentinula aciculospora]
MRSLPKFKIIPKDYTFVAYTKLFLTSIPAKRVQNELYARALHRDPDMYDILGFWGHDASGAFALIEEHFDKIMEKVAEKQWDAVYVLLDGFMMYNFRACPKPMYILDTERKHGLLRLYGALIVTMLRELDQQGRLDVQHFPNLEYFLRYTIEWSEWAKYELVNRCHLKSDILPHLGVCKAIAYRLFKNQTEEDHTLHLARIREWVQWLEPRITEEDTDYAGTKAWVQNWLIEEWPCLLLGVNPWYLAGKDDNPLWKDLRLDLEREWSSFSEYRKVNLLVPPKGLSWEFKDWPEEERDAHRDGTVFEPPSDESVDGDSSDRESMGWGMERSFWKM